MPIFECSKCHAVDNTALTNFWWNTLQENKPALCSECDPDIAKWHGQFPKTSASDYLKQGYHIEFPVKAVLDAAKGKEVVDAE